MGDSWVVGSGRWAMGDLVQRGVDFVLVAVYEIFSAIAMVRERCWLGQLIHLVLDWP